MREWYRNTEWNDEIEKEFFARLSRARSQRDQYIVIQALTLAESFPKVALRLVDYYFDTRTEDFHDGRARMAAATAQFADGGYEEALDAFQEALEGQAADNGLLVTSPLAFAFLSARYRSARHYDLALAGLADLPVPDTGPPVTSFQYHAARALILHETGRDPAGAKRDAAIALGLPDEVTATFADVTWRLRGVVKR